MEEKNFYDILKGDKDDYLGSADMDNGASVDFVTNSYVQNLVNTYASVDSKGIAGPKR